MTPTNLNPLFIDQIKNFAHLVTLQPQTKEQFLSTLKESYSLDNPKTMFFYQAVEKSVFETIQLSRDRASLLFNHLNINKEETKHTSGRWSFFKSGDKYLVKTTGGENNVLAEVFAPEGAKEGEEEANAKLIAAAPELLAGIDNLDKAAMLFADDHKHYYEAGNQDKIDEMLANLHNEHLKVKALIESLSK